MKLIVHFEAEKGNAQVQLPSEKSIYCSALAETSPFDRKGVVFSILHIAEEPGAYGSGSFYVEHLNQYAISA